MKNPFGSAARAYYDAGWPSVFPLPFLQKMPPPDGVTGASAKYVKPKQLKKWLDPKYRMEFRDGTYRPGVTANIAFRMPKNVIGIDIDWYGDKPGKETIEEAVKLWGPLPETWRSSARDDGFSGILLFRVPRGLAWPGNLDGLVGRGVDFIRWDHRYMLVEPSVHPRERSMYRWYDPQGGLGNFPTPDILPKMPDKWVSGITSGQRWVQRPAAMEMDTDESNAWMDERPPDMCSHMEALVSAAIGRVEDAASTHDTLNEAVWQIVRDAGAGHGGGVGALARLREAFLADVLKRKKRGEREAKREWYRTFLGAVQKAAMEPVEADDPCALYEDSGRAERSERVRKSGSSLYDYKTDDIGNAQRLLNRVGDDIRYVEALGGWHVWSEGMWRFDYDGQVRRWAIETVRDMGEELKFVEDPKERDAFKQFIKACGNSSRLVSMIDWAKSMRGITIKPDVFDSDKRKLLVGNGLVLLKRDGVEFRPVRREDYVTLRAAGAYVPGSWEGTPWVNFLDRFVPELDVRAWLQKAVGYSLLGANPQRLLFFINGKTSSGKSTFGEAVRDCLGEYGAPFNPNLFRDQREQGPNVQLVRMLGKRFILSSEVSDAIVLHADAMKRMTGGEALSARLNRSNELVERVPPFTPWIGTNGMPTVNGADAALWRRLRVIPFDQTIAAADEDYTVQEWLKTPEGHTAVLTWAVEGWAAYAASGLEDMPPAVVMATMKAREELSEFHQWMAVRCEFGPEFWCTAEELYSDYQQWCSDNGIKNPETGRRFARLLSGQNIERSRRRTAEQDGDNKTWGRAGIRLVPLRVGS